MKKSSLLITVSMALTLTGCGQAGQQWWNPDTTFASLGQPDVKGVNDTQEDSAKEAVAAGDFTRAAKFYEILGASGKGTKEQMLRYKLGYANAIRRMGDNDRALDLFEGLVKDNPENLDAAEGRALTLMAVGKTLDASRAFSDIVEKDPKRWRTLNALGILFVTKNMIPEAMTYYTEALKYSPDNPAVLNNIGLSQAIDKNYKRASDVLDQANRMSKNPAQRKQIDLNLAMVSAVAGDLDKAYDLASKYYDGAALDNNMGLYAHLSKDDGLAKTYLNMALSQSPTYYERAWSNLDALNDNDNDTSKTKEVKKMSAPAPVAESKPVEKPVEEKASASKNGKASRSKQPEKHPFPAKAEAKPEPKAEVKPETKVEEKAADPKVTDAKSDAKDVEKKTEDKKQADAATPPADKSEKASDKSDKEKSSN
jgi:Flp pilus assembly protein TadD